MQPRIRSIDIAIDTPVDSAAAWRAVSDPARIAEWFTDATALGPVGSPYRLDFGDGSVVGGTVLAIEPGRSFTHSWAWEGASATEVTNVTWSVEALPGGGTRIRLLHEGWDEAGLDRASRDDHEGYWTGDLEDLTDVLAEA